MKGGRILVADDEKGMRDFLGILLRKEATTWHLPLPAGRRWR